MDFEKAYKESFEAAKGLHDAGNALTKKQMEIVFPQLRESEDERIRKALIEVFKEKLERGFEWVEYGIPNRSVLSWLEKQKDVCKAIETVERIDKYIDAHTANAHDMDDSNPDKKYYSGVDDTLSDIAGILNGVYSEEKLKEQKHKFKVGDRVTNGECVYTIDKIGKDCYWVKEHDCATIPFEYEDTWRIEQKPAEWSEEDEMYLSQAIETLEHENYSILADKLKSLRSRVGKEFLQPHWEPSEEQMNMLAMFTNLRCASRHEANTLESLYNDLKKLM